MFHRVKQVKPLSNYHLNVQFMNGEHKYYDVRPLFQKCAPFRTLTMVDGLFEQVKVDIGGYGISWNDELDLACDELYNNGKTT